MFKVLSLSLSHDYSLLLLLFRCHLLCLLVSRSSSYMRVCCALCVCFGGMPVRVCMHMYLCVCV